MDTLSQSDSDAERWVATLDKTSLYIEINNRLKQGTSPFAFGLASDSRQRAGKVWSAWSLECLELSLETSLCDLVKTLCAPLWLNDYK